MYERRVSWKLIINLYCHSNIIVNLNRRHIFNATFQINVWPTDGVRFRFCFQPSTGCCCIDKPHTIITLYIEHVPIAKICGPSTEIKAIATIFRVPFKTILFISFVDLIIQQNILCDLVHIQLSVGCLRSLFWLKNCSSDSFVMW